jgi:hypothetical protein
MHKDELLPPSEAAVVLDVCENTLARWRAQATRLSEDEVAVLFEAICDDLESSGFSSSANSSDDVHMQYRKMTDRELIGVILTSSTA